MKQFIIIACLYLSGIASAFAQDESGVRCYYATTQLKGEIISQDTMALDISSSLSKFYDPSRTKRDSILGSVLNNLKPHMINSINIVKGESAADMSSKPGTTTASASNQGESYQIYKDRADNKLTFIDYTSIVGDRYLYEEPLEPLPWVISTDTCTLLSYPCQKASLHFRGRDYTAWFSPEIPISEGPWKFRGLPGLILKIEDSQQVIMFSLVGIEQSSKALDIKIEERKYIKCSRKDLEKQIKNQGGAGTQINVNGGEVTIAELPGVYHYTPLELD